MQMIASWPARMDIRDVATWAQRVERLGFDVMHVPETIHDPFVVAALALNATSRLVARTSMVVAFPRSPMVTAYAAWDLAGYSGGRFELGVASQVRGNIVGRFSTEWSEPVTRLGDYIDSLRDIFTSFETGAPLNHDGPHYRFDRLQTYFNPGPLNRPAPLIWTGGVNRGMCVMAGAKADGFVCHPTSSHPRILTARILPALAEGASRAGRTDGGPAVVTNPQPMMATSRAALAQLRGQRRAELAFLYSTPAYRPQLEVFGPDETGLQPNTPTRTTLPDDLMDLLVPQGLYEDVPAILAERYSGLCAGITLSVPADDTDDAALRQVVEQCKLIPTAARG